ncbi:1,4-dihydroxy-2-naphthoate polyprenyltransferase [Virgibacillus pantothenticus]|uniref:1,4-dihydroxy-2-naphthoate polyprenyltransferase n=1 Tax=Virgibacillus pantothenticus TaxID=1473 RepID=UPI000986246A|nr:1,4-dihydroxy-2-naphthoate polyprenyltransferase [Virgibacillus pantothenticus]
MHSSNKVTIKDALNERDGFQIWWRLLRPHTLTASFVPVFVGSMLAFHEGHMNIFLFMAMLIASMLIQAATNMFNEYYDFVKGLDNEESVGIGGTIVRDGIKPKTVLHLALSFFGIAMLLGAFISATSSWWIAAIGLICMLFGYLYTGGPYPIAYTPLGELFSGFLMGTVIIGISYFIQAKTITLEVILASIPIAIFIGAILLSNNIRDLDNDKENGRKTLAILLGRKRAIGFLALMFLTAFFITAWLIIKGIFPLWSFITFIGAIKAVDVIQKFKGKTQPLEMMPAMAATGKTNSIYGILLGISLFISTFIN